MTFSLRPIRGSVLPLMAASVRTLVVSWNDAAERNESVASEALVIPIRVGAETAYFGSTPFSSASLARRSFSRRKSIFSTTVPGRNLESPASTILTFLIIWRTMTSICLSLMSTPCIR